jgi:hypothetical protein
MINHPSRKRYSATVIAPGRDNNVLVERGSLEDAVAGAVKFGARYDDNAIEALEQGRQIDDLVCLQCGKHPDEYVRIERVS